MKATRSGLVLSVLCLALLASLVAGCGKGPEKSDANGTGKSAEKGGEKRATLVGSTSVQPFAEILAEEYKKRNPDVHVTVQGGGSGQGIQAIANGIADIGTCSRDLTADEKAKFTGVVIARDGIAVVVHPDNKVKGLTLQQVQDIFSGKITNWKNVGGEDHAIALVQREDGSGTREAFEKLIMGKSEVSKDAMVQASNGAVKALVKGNPYLVGYMSLGQVKGDLKAVEVDGMIPTEAGVASGAYKLWRPFLFVTKGPPAPEAQKFIDFALSKAGQAILVKEGLVGAPAAAASSTPATQKTAP